MPESVKVGVRLRPLNSMERKNRNKVIVKVDSTRNSVHVQNPQDLSQEPKVFSYHWAFDMDSRQTDVYESTAHPIVESVLEGFNGTIFAYGQTGTGKTFTMTGDPKDPTLRGITPNAFEHIFSHIALQSSDNKKFLVSVSYLEIYNEQVNDLLDSKNKNLKVRQNEDKIFYVEGLSKEVCNSVESISEVLDRGSENRAVGSTNMNEKSSRSHSIFMITVETCETDDTGIDHIKVGKLNLVDLAGSERIKKTGAENDRRNEGININLSLMVLSNVISALISTKKNVVVPYRESKLTQLLQDSLGGNSKTVMIATIGPADYNHEETATTCRYAKRASNVKNKPKINEDPKDAMLRDLQDEIRRLKAALGGQPLEAGQNIMIPGAPGETVYLPGEVQKIEVVRTVEVGMKEEEYNRKIKEIEDKIRSQTVEEQQKLLEEKKRLQEEQQAFEEELKAKEDALEKEAQAKRLMASKIKQMEEQVLVGSVIAEKAKAQEIELYKMRLENEERKRQETLLARQLAEREEQQILVEEQFKDIQEECEKKTQKIQKLYKLYKGAKQEIRDINEEFSNDRADLLETIRELTSQLRLRMMIIDQFVPMEMASELERRAELQSTGDWVVPGLDTMNNLLNVKRPIPLNGRRLISKFTIEQSRQTYADDVDSATRFLDNNILHLDLDLPTDEHFANDRYDDELREIDWNQQNDTDDRFFVYQGQEEEEELNKRKNKLDKTVLSRSKSRDKQDNIPKARGLVKDKIRYN
eukprot:TRINITY_DN3224_c0_g2_i2.p1 TRINITY_DN3224_c0_g2~~TRINITY_DN3224_c0_g2_i2.p1  ORF type:complete len:755 (+),score=237.05 TRINITY_DN3224_c0_g2_i2:40-2304(+)